MIRRADNVLVFDLELTCWNDLPPEGMCPEIIQIGWCFLDPRSGERTGMDSRFVKPVTSTISEYCTELTGITPAMVKQAHPWEHVCKHLLKLGLKQYASAGYGSDWSAVKQECEYSNSEMFLSDEYLDISLLAKLALNSYKNVSLKNACAKFGVVWEGPEHRADFDAWNTAELLGKLLQTDWRKIVL